MFKNLILLILCLEWQYPYNRSNIVFEVWGSPSMTAPAWTQVGETADLRWQFDATGPAGFFKVRAKDTQTGLVSPWATR